MVSKRESKIEFYPDTSRHLHAYTVVNNGNRYLQTEEPFRHHLDFDDFRIKKFHSKDKPPEVSFKLGVGIAPTQFLLDNVDNPHFGQIVKQLLSDTELTLQETRVSLKFKGKDLFSIFGGIPAVSFKPETPEQLEFDPKNQLLGYWFDIRSANPELPDMRVSLAIIYDLKKINQGYLFDIPFGSDEFYKIVRPGINAYLVLSSIPAKK